MHFLIKTLHILQEKLCSNFIDTHKCNVLQIISHFLSFCKVCFNDTTCDKIKEMIIIKKKRKYPKNMP